MYELKFDFIFTTPEEHEVEVAVILSYLVNDGDEPVVQGMHLDYDDDYECYEDEIQQEAALFGKKLAQEAIRKNEHLDLK